MLYAWRAPGPALRHRLRHRQPRERPRRQQPPPRRRHLRRLLRHHVAAPRRGPHRAQGLGRPALLRPRLHPLHGRARRRSCPLFATLPWKRGSLAARHAAALGRRSPSRVALGALVWALQTGGSMLAPIGAALAAWLVLGALADLAGRVRLGAGRLPPRRCAGRATCRAPTGARRSPTPASASRSSASPRSPPGRSRTSALVQPGERFPVAGYELRFDGVDRRPRPELRRRARHRHRLPRRPRRSRRCTPRSASTTSRGWRRPRPASTAALTRDLYVALGDPQGDGWALRTYVKPFSNWIWARRAASWPRAASSASPTAATASAPPPAAPPAPRAAE